MKTYKAKLSRQRLIAHADVLVSIEAETKEEAIEKLKAGNFIEHDYDNENYYGIVMDKTAYKNWVKLNEPDFEKDVEEIDDNDQLEFYT